MLLGRWRLSLDLFGRVFMEDVGLEPGSVVAELGGFPVKESKFRREMEKLRNLTPRDLTLHKMERERTQLIIQTFKELNAQYNNYSRRSTTTQPALAVNRVKVTFKDEPGEGSGVARSFYTAVAEALLANEKLPNLDAAQVGGNSTSGNSGSGGKYAHMHSVLQRLQRSSSRRTSANAVRSNTRGAGRDHWRQLSYDARAYVPTPLPPEGLAANLPGPSQQSSSGGGSSSGNSGNEHLTIHQQQLGERLYPLVS